MVCKQFMPSKQTVEGSNPSAITNKKPQYFWGFLFNLLINFQLNVEESLYWDEGVVL